MGYPCGLVSIKYKIMQRTFLATLLAVISCSEDIFANAQSSVDTQDYSDFEAIAYWAGVDWEPYLVETEDGWLITVFRLLGRNGERPS